MKIPNIIYTLVILAGTVVLAGCGKDTDEVPVVNPIPNDSPNKGTVERPTEWLDWRDDVIDDYNPQSMTITCDAAGIGSDVDSLDLMASFIEGRCCGCAEPYTMPDGRKLFFLTVQLRNSVDRSGDIPVTYRYYSHKGRKLYTCGPLDFVFDGRWGTIQEPYHFGWKAIN